MLMLETKPRTSKTKLERKPRGADGKRRDCAKHNHSRCKICDHKIRGPNHDNGDHHKKAVRQMRRKAK